MEIGKSEKGRGIGILKQMEESLLSGKRNRFYYLNPPTTLVVAESACSRPYPNGHALSLTPSLLLSALRLPSN